MKKQSYEYYAGRDCARNGANTTNCNYKIFSTPEKLKEWERGKNSILSTPNTKVCKKDE